MSSLSALFTHFGFQTQVFFSGEFCGHTQFAENEKVGHMHLVRRGPVIMEHDKQPHLHIQSPTFVFYPRPYNHRLVIPSSSADLICATISFKDAKFNPFINALPDFISIPLDELKGLEPILNVLFDEASHQEIGSKMAMDRLCDILIIQMIRRLLKTGIIRKSLLAGFSDARLAPVLAAIHDNPSRSWTVEDMAQIALMSRSKFAKYFPSVMDMTPAEYLTKWRMSLAETMLKETRSVKKTAQAIGYATAPAFTRAFTLNFGMPPKKWLEQLI